MTVTIPEMPICGCLGCHESAVAVIDHPNGRRTVCEKHAAGFRRVKTV